MLISFGLTSNQAFAGGNGCFGPGDEGIDCGDETNNDCTNPDTCDDSGNCQDNHEAEFFACGDPEPNNECSNQNTCNGQGTCLARNVAAETPCDANGDKCTTDECDGQGTCVAGPSECVVGGEMIPIGTTSLILAGTQSAFSWMIPITVSAVGIAIVIARKFSKYQPE